MRFVTFAHERSMRSITQSSLQVLKRNSAYHSSDVFTVIRAEDRPSQRVNKKPHKVWVTVQTDATILLSADMTVLYGIISLCVCDCQ